MDRWIAPAGFSSLQGWRSRPYTGYWLYSPGIWFQPLRDRPKGKNGNGFIAPIPYERSAPVGACRCLMPEVNTLAMRTAVARNKDVGRASFH